MMRRWINNILSVIYSLLKFSIIKLFHWKNFSFSIVERFSPNVVLELNRSSRVFFGKKVRVHSGSKIKVRKGAQLKIGSNTRINYNCMIFCHNKIEIGEGAEFGPSVYIYDHDHDYRKGLKQEEFKSEPVIIGRECWIGASTVILRGTVLGDNCVVGAGCVLKGNYKAGSVIVQKRNTDVYIENG